MHTECYLHAGITEKIIGCAMKVHRYFGLGFPEAIYQRALIIELEKAGLKCRAEVERDVYDEEYFIRKRRQDLVLEDKVPVEMKALSELDKACVNQILNYLRVFKIEFGLLLNFGCESLQYKQLVNTKSISEIHTNTEICDICLTHYRID